MARHEVISFRGADGISERLKQMADLSEVKEIVLNNTVELTGEAQEGAPVDTGYLRRSIVMSIENDGMSGHVNAMADYARPINDGTRHRDANPFMSRAFYAQKKQFETDLKDLF